MKMRRISFVAQLAVVSALSGLLGATTKPVGAAEYDGGFQCFYTPPNPPSCEACPPFQCKGSGWLCCN